MIIHNKYTAAFGNLYYILINTIILILVIKRCQFLLEKLSWRKSTLCFKRVLTRITLINKMNIFKCRKTLK